MKTAVIFWTQEDLKLFVISGDLSKFQDVYINSSDCDPDLVQELGALFWDDEGNNLIEPCDLEEFSEAIRQGSLLITCGFIL